MSIFEISQRDLSFKKIEFELSVFSTNRIVDTKYERLKVRSKMCWCIIPTFLGKLNSLFAFTEVALHAIVVLTRKNSVFVSVFRFYLMCTMLSKCVVDLYDVMQDLDD